MPKSLYSPDNYAQTIDRLAAIVEELRISCPWDKKQTFESLLPQSTEELFELQDAILEKDWQNVKEELGDLLLHILFYSKMAQEIDAFDLAEVIEGVANKLVRRHPHVYEFSEPITDAEDVKKRWETLKKKEGKKSILSGVPKSTPPLEKAFIIQNKVKHVGFDFDHIDQVLDKCREEWTEMEEALQEDNKDHLEEELGDVLFSVINLIRYTNLDPSRCLDKTNQKFHDRFQFVEEQVHASGKDWEAFDLEALDSFWKKAKDHL